MFNTAPSAPRGEVGDVFACVGRIHALKYLKFRLFLAKSKPEGPERGPFPLVAGRFDAGDLALPRFHEEGRYETTWKGEFKLLWRKAGPLKSS